jgi:hypothetical protein
VSGATVALGPQSQKTSDDGTFAFDMDGAHDGGLSVQNSEGIWVPRFKSDALFAVKAGKLPTRIELPPIPQMRSHAVASTFTLALAGEPLEIRGRVVDENGKPIDHAVVRIEDETPFGMVYEKVQGEGVGTDTTAEAMSRGQAAYTNTFSDKDGAFKLGGLLDREYQVMAVDTHSLRRSAIEPIRAGTSATVIHLPECKDCVRLAGRVVALDGTPIVGARVALYTRIGDSPTPMYGPTTETDKEGRFEFGPAVAVDIHFSVVHPDIFLLFSWKPDEKAALDALEIRVARKAHVQVDLGNEKTRADHFKLFDAHDQAIDMAMSRGNMMWFPDKAEIVDGKSEAVACAENGATLVLYKDDKEIARLPVHLVPGEVVTVRP